MIFCDKCGSSSIDKDGFCGGCGAHYTLAQLGAKNRASEPKVPSVVESMPVNPLAEVQIPNMELAMPREKNIWIAILLTTFFGPLGLAYCTFSGAIVMFILSIALRFFLGGYLALLVWPVCVLWAWWAVRSGSDGWTLW